jgi:hypothetical protein
LKTKQSDEIYNKDFEVREKKWGLSQKVIQGLWISGIGLLDTVFSSP